MTCPCCGCQTCPDLCGYYIKAQAGSYIGRPIDPETDLPIESNVNFCDGNTFIDYSNSALQAETEGTPGAPSYCGLSPGGGLNVTVGYDTSTSAASLSASIGGVLYVEGEATVPGAGATLSLDCNDGEWSATATITFSLGASSCSASKNFIIRRQCSENSESDCAASASGANIDGLTVTVSGDGVLVTNLGLLEWELSGDCEDECISEWVSLWQAVFVVERVPCKCSGPCDEYTPCSGNFYCCESCCELGCYGADNEVIGGIAITTPNTAKGAYRTGFAAGCNRVGAPGEFPFPLPSNSIQFCNVSEGCPEGYAEVTSQSRIYDTDGNILAERGSICCPIEVNSDPCADNPAP